MTAGSWRTGLPPKETGRGWQEGGGHEAISVQGDLGTLAGKVALIAGETRGIGLRVARSLARRGAQVFLVTRDGDCGERAAAEIKASEGDVSVDVLSGDLNQIAGVRAVAAAFLSGHGVLDILVNVSNPSETHLVAARGTQGAPSSVPDRLLTELLRGALRRSDLGRVVAVSASSAAAFQPDMRSLAPIVLRHGPACSFQDAWVALNLRPAQRESREPAAPAGMSPRRGGR